MLTLRTSNRHEEEIKKSRFIATAVRVDSPEEAMRALEGLSDPSATHNCWAYRIGDQYRFNDDGEPGGTAGRPILAAIEGQGLDHVLVVVTRFYGGTKLGAGGLVRAYGGSAAECMRTADRELIEAKSTLLVRAPFDLTGSVYPILARFEVEKISEEFEQSGIALTVEIAESKISDFKKALGDATRGSARVDPASE